MAGPAIEALWRGLHQEVQVQDLAWRDTPAGNRALAAIPEGFHQPEVASQFLLGVLAYVDNIPTVIDDRESAAASALFLDVTSANSSEFLPWSQEWLMGATWIQGILLGRFGGVGWDVDSADLEGVGDDEVADFLDTVGPLMLAAANRAEQEIEDWSSTSARPRDTSLAEPGPRAPTPIDDLVVTRLVGIDPFPSTAARDAWIRGQLGAMQGRGPGTYVIAVDLDGNSLFMLRPAAFEAQKRAGANLEDIGYVTFQTKKYAAFMAKASGKSEYVPDLSDWHARPQ